VAITAATNDHVDVVNAAVQAARCRVGHLERDHAIPIAGGEHAHPGDVVATRANDRRASPRSVEASSMRSGDARDTTEVRPGVP
jgi:hypothetical protein